MSTEQPENDPFRKQEQPQSGEPGGPPGGGTPGGTQDGGPGGGPPGAYGSPPPPAPPPPGADPYGGQGGNPYGGQGGNPYVAGPMGTADPLAGMPPLASRAKRLVARIIDALIVGIPVGLVVGLSDGYSTNTGQNYWQQAVYTLVYLLYEGLMLTRSGQTVGKKLMRIRVAMLDNGAVPAGSPGWLRAATYSLPALVPCFGFLFWLVNVLFCTWDQPYHQCLHDKVARTVVVAAD